MTAPQRILALLLAATAAGCAHPPSHPDAQVVASGTPPLSFTAPSHGMVYVRDLSTRSLRHTGVIATAMLLTVDPDSDKVTLRNLETDQSVDLLQSVDAAHRYEIAFRRMDSIDHGSVRELVEPAPTTSPAAGH